MEVEKEILNKYRKIENVEKCAGGYGNRKEKILQRGRRGEEQEEE